MPSIKAEVRSAFRAKSHILCWNCQVVLGNVQLGIMERFLGQEHVKNVMKNVRRVLGA